ncbi:MAG: protease inhibitor I9 family protein, partial [Gemmatimonadota bacterium]|nr:protease inhibitor I9 family protein [Gemmatimonadota bacterium]
MTKKLGALLGLAVAVACNDLASPVPVSSVSPKAALVAEEGSIPGSYIVLADWNTNALSLATSYGVQPKYVYEELVNGFAAAMPSTVADALAADPRVLKVTVQRQISTVETASQSGATWGLDRIDQRLLPIDSTYT